MYDLTYMVVFTFCYHLEWLGNNLTQLKDKTKALTIVSFSAKVMIAKLTQKLACIPKKTIILVSRVRLAEYPVLRVFPLWLSFRSSAGVYRGGSPEALGYCHESRNTLKKKFLNAHLLLNCLCSNLRTLSNTALLSLLQSMFCNNSYLLYLCKNIMFDDIIPSRILS